MRIELHWNIIIIIIWACTYGLQHQNKIKYITSCSISFIIIIISIFKKKIYVAIIISPYKWIILQQIWGESEWERERKN